MPKKKKQEDVNEEPTLDELESEETIDTDTEEEQEKEQEKEPPDSNLYQVIYELDGIRYQVEELALSEEHAKVEVYRRVIESHPGHDVAILE